MWCVEDVCVLSVRLRGVNSIFSCVFHVLLLYVIIDPFFFLIFDLFSVFFFFFQAEDGIRDGHVTGVQTCALPIFPGLSAAVQISNNTLYDCGARRSLDSGGMTTATNGAIAVAMKNNIFFLLPGRSEERRVGKDCRFGVSPTLLQMHTRMTIVFMMW